MAPNRREQLGEAAHRLASDRNDAGAWETLFAVSWPTAIAATNRVLGGQLDAAEDAAQEAYRRLARYCDFGKLADGDAFLAYLQAVARNVALDARRKLATSPERPDDDEQIGLFPSNWGGGDPEAALREAELRRELDSELNGEERKLLALLLEEYSPAEIAGKLGVTPSAARVRIHRLRDKLRKRLPGL